MFMEVVLLRIILNGREEELNEEMTIAQLIEARGINGTNIIVERNYELVKSQHWSEVLLQEGDRLEILRLVGGG